MIDFCCDFLCHNGTWRDEEPHLQKINRKSILVKNTKWLEVPGKV